MALQGWDKNYREQLKIKDQQIEQTQAENAQLKLMISGGGGNRPGEDAPYRPPDPKEVPGVPPGYPHIPKMLAGHQELTDYLNRTGRSGRTGSYKDSGKSPEEILRHLMIGVDRFKV